MPKCVCKTKDGVRCSRDVSVVGEKCYQHEKAGCKFGAVKAASGKKTPPKAASKGASKGASVGECECFTKDGQHCKNKVTVGTMCTRHTNAGGCSNWSPRPVRPASPVLPVRPASPVLPVRPASVRRGPAPPYVPFKFEIPKERPEPRGISVSGVSGDEFLDELYAGDPDGIAMKFINGGGIIKYPEYGITALYYSVKKNKVNIARMLLLNGVSPNILAGNKSLGHLASNNKEMFDLIMKYGGRQAYEQVEINNAIGKALETNDIDAIIDMIRGGLNPNFEYNGSNLLYNIIARNISSNRDESKYVEFFLKAGANVNQKNKDGETALDRAIILLITHTQFINYGAGNIVMIPGDDKYPLIELLLSYGAKTSRVYDLGKRQNLKRLLGM
jgi:hypothetical protein